MQFYADGTCEVEEEVGGRNKRPRSQRQQPQQPQPQQQPPQQLATGRWKYDKYGLNWELAERGVRHFYHAELIWHSFGSFPKMHGGIIVRDRGPRSLLPPWFFRPVVGIFHGRGNGTDTYLSEVNENRFSNM